MGEVETLMQISDNAPGEPKNLSSNIKVGSNTNTNTNNFQLSLKTLQTWKLQVFYSELWVKNKQKNQT